MNSTDNVTHIGHNGLQPDMVRRFTDRIENLLSELETEKGEYMQRCRALRDDIKDVLQEAKDSGLPKREFRAVIRTRQLAAKLEKIRDDLDGEQQESYDQIRHALGDLADLPLGGAALARHPDGPQSA